MNRLRRLWLILLRWRTVYMLEQIDAERQQFIELRDYGIPTILRSLEAEKTYGLGQLHALNEAIDGPQSTSFSLPPASAEIQPSSTTGDGWSPSATQPAGPLFSSRTQK